MASGKKSRYIHDQGWSLLKDFANPLRHLAAPHLPESPDPSRPQETPWESIGRSDILAGSVVLDDRPIPLRRLVFTSDSGGGKSEALRWIWHEVNRAGKRKIALRFEAGVFHSSRFKSSSSASIHSDLTDYLADQLIQPTLDKASSTDQHAAQRALAYRMIERARREGTLLLLIDGLDQAASRSDLLQTVVQSEFWSQCTIVLAGREYAVVTRKALFAAGLARQQTDELSWKFVRVNELTRSQVTEYLQLGRDGRPRYEEIPERIRPLLSNPRVLWYMLDLEPAEYRTLESGADLYERVLGKIIYHGHANSAEARLLGHTGTEETVPDQPQKLALEETWQVLQTIAYVMLFHSRPELDETTDAEHPTFNFDQVSKDKFGAFAPQVEQLWTTRSAGGWNWVWRSMAALGSPLAQGVFETEAVQGLNQVLFRNRTLLEYLAARYLAQRGTAADAQRLQQWLYRPDRPESKALYWVWQYLCEMPDTVTNGTARSWLRVIEPLFHPASRSGDSRSKGPRGVIQWVLSWIGLKKLGSGATTWTAQRSTEMIFRSWPKLSRLCTDSLAGKRAQNIRNQWQGEFVTICNGDQGPDRQRFAIEFSQDFLHIPEGKFDMGSRSGRRELSADLRGVFVEGFQEARGFAVDQFIDRWMDRRPQLGGPGPQRDEIRSVWREYWREALRRERERVGTGLTYFEQLFAEANEERQKQVSVDAFELGRSPVLNGWYRLFAPDHGLSPTPWAKDYETYSGDDGQPAIYISFYDAWAFCQWARFADGRVCRLPWEHEWEYVAKYGVDPNWAYWWHATEFHDDKATAYQQDKPLQTTPPTPAHANPATQNLDHPPAGRGVGVMDQLGNVWEWCQDQYEEIARRDSCDAPGLPDRSRVLRGGSFDSNPDGCRASVRNRRRPTYIFNVNGFRAARACSPR
jgi:formylglycine-generating enzyme required for sulfatase activity